MQAERPEDQKFEKDMNYDLILWQGRLVASEVFVLPTVSTGTGTRHLLAISRQAQLDFAANRRTLVAEGSTAHHDHQYVYWSAVWNRNERRRNEGGLFDEAAYERSLITKTTPYENQRDRIYAARDLVVEIRALFIQLTKLAISLLELQEEQGDQITHSDYALKKLTICINCIDAVWTDMLKSYDKLLKLNDAIVTAKAALPPVERNMKLVMIDTSAQDREGYIMPPQALITYDPANMTHGERMVLGGLEGERGDVEARNESLASEGTLSGDVDSTEDEARRRAAENEATGVFNMDGSADRVVDEGAGMGDERADSPSVESVFNTPAGEGND